MILAVVMAPIQIWVRGRRWWYLFPPGSNPQGVTPAMMIGYMANNVLPLRAGEVVRVYVVARRWNKAPGASRSHPFWTTLATLIVERVLDSLIVVLILAVLVLVVPVPRFLEVAALIVLDSSRACSAAGRAFGVEPSPRSRRSCTGSTGSGRRRTRSR